MKFFLMSIFLLSFLNATLVDGIALIVNKKPVTLYDIDKKMEQYGFSREKAISSIIDDILYKQQLKKYNIDITLLDVDNYIEKLAASNNMNLLDFKLLIRQQRDYDEFVDQIKKQLTHQELIKKISQGNIKVVTDEDMQIYYENHKNQYKIANQIDVVAYVSENKQLLNELRTNPMMNIDGVMSQNITFTQNDLSPQVKYIVNNTKVGAFSVIFSQNRRYNMFFIKDKKDERVQSFDEVKNQIFNTMMKQREQKYLQSYFETLKITADVKVLR